MVLDDDVSVTDDAPGAMRGLDARAYLDRSWSVLAGLGLRLVGVGNWKPEGE